MKTKEHSKEVKDKVIEWHNLSLRCKIIFKELDIQVSTAGSIRRKWKLHHSTQALPRQGHPSKLTQKQDTD